MICPNCGEEVVHITGSVYDDGEYIGERLECLECDHQWTGEKDPDFAKWNIEKDNDIPM